ncbi:metal-sensing transcriptional repressor [Helicobacter trogontum]|uniref:Metal-sensitive transcriptional repressor n=1 Tax=Helicobacter trogontum TaxID=50960 RepID=A0A4U8SC45_9HELI|nr:metal-sensing transcriptional repressor [Helicobacter trogontum]TLD83635.1 metal-sensitive transcriptional repressor [Helicobacter trogontum]
MEKENAKNIHRRLKKISGQLNAIDKMVDDEVACVDILIQINAAKSALHKVGQIVLEGHVTHCMKDAIKHGDSDKSLDELAKAIEHFSRMS